MDTKTFDKFARAVSGVKEPEPKKSRKAVPGGVLVHHGGAIMRIRQRRLNKEGRKDK